VTFNEFEQCKYSFNDRVQPNPDWSGPEFRFLSSDDMIAFHRSLAGYRATPLVALPGLAAELGIGALYVKDESHRFGIKAFKALGASYAIYRFLDLNEYPVLSKKPDYHNFQVRNMQHCRQFLTYHQFRHENQSQ